MTDMLLGGIGLTHLTVYQDQPGPDGVHAGCAHIHALTPEAYFGVSGEGAIELHDAENGYRRLEIHKGTFVQFPPGTLHRSVSTDHLEVMAIMGNGGLAERGDARIYFGEEVDADPNEYDRLRGLVLSGQKGAMERRDASAKAYSRLMTLWDTDRAAYSAEITRFLSVHQQSIADKAETFQRVIEAGPVAAGELALQNLAALASPHANSGLNVSTADINDVKVVYGMCGRLRQIESLRPA